MECTDLWNQYFDTHAVDFILTPSMWGDGMEWQGMVHNKCHLNVKQPDGSYAMEETDGFWAGAFMSFAKPWAVPKLLIPLGYDAEGRPVSCTCWGKAVPRAHLYDDEFAKTWDLEFMYKVRRTAAPTAAPCLSGNGDVCIRCGGWCRRCMASWGLGCSRRRRRSTWTCLLHQANSESSRYRGLRS